MTLSLSTQVNMWGWQRIATDPRSDHVGIQQLDALNYLHIPNTNTISNTNTIIIIINNSIIMIITWQSYMGNIYLVLIVMIIVIIIIVTITIIPIIIIVLMKQAIVDHR